MSGFQARLFRSWELTKASFAVLRSDRNLLVFPLAAAVASLLIAIVFFVPAALTGVAWDDTNDSLSVAGYVILFAFYLVQYTIVIASQTALVGCALIRMNGGTPTIEDGIRIAQQRLPSIVGYAAIAATVGVILQAVRERSNALGDIVAGILGGAWHLVTFLIVPVLVVENVGPIEGIKRSGSLLKRTWGENIIGSGAIGLIFGVFAFAIVGLGVLLAIGLGSLLGIAGVIVIAVVVIVALAVVSLIGSALSGIYTAALYQYAVGNDTGGFYDDRTFEAAFRPKGI